MGRFATNIAATMANADNLPPTNALPNISLWDVLLPSQNKKKKPLDPNVGMRVYREFYDVKKDKNGKSMVVAHKGGSKKGEASKEDHTKKDNKKDGGGGDGGRGGQQEKGNGDGAEQNHGGDNIEYTPEQDAKIKLMKAENKTWAEIAQEVGGTKGTVKNRFNRLKHEDSGDGKRDEGNKKNEQKEKNAEADKTKNEKKKDKKNKKQNNKPAEAPKAPSKAPSKTPSRNGEARFTMGEWRTLQEDDLFSFGELQCLSELAMRDEQQQWLRIASAFADKTGRRVHPDDIRDKFAELERMGSGR